MNVLELLAEYLSRTLFQWWWALIGAALLAWELVARLAPDRLGEQLKLTRPRFLMVAAGALLVAQFLVYREVRLEIEELNAERRRSPARSPVTLLRTGEGLELASVQDFGKLLFISFRSTVTLQPVRARIECSDAVTGVEVELQGNPLGDARYEREGDRVIYVELRSPPLTPSEVLVVKLRGSEDLRILSWRQLP